MEADDIRPQEEPEAMQDAMKRNIPLGLTSGAIIMKCRLRIRRRRGNAAP
jgi:hypothetical protein